MPEGPEYSGNVVREPTQDLSVEEAPVTPTFPHPERIRREVTCLNLLQEGPGQLPADFDVQLTNILLQHGKLIVIPTAGEGFSEDVEEAKLVRVTGQRLYDCLYDGQTCWLDELYRGPWLDMARLFTGNPELQAFDDLDRAYVLNALFEPGQFFPTHVDFTAGSIAIGVRNPPESDGGAFYISAREKVVGIEGLKRRAGYKIYMDPGVAVIFDGSNKLHGSAGINLGDEPRTTLACSYWDESDLRKRRPATFDERRKTL